MGKNTVLIIEDDASLSLINRRALEPEGYDVLTAFTLAEARDQLARANPDVILLDVKMPDGSGFDFCLEIRENTGAHIIFLTSVTETAGELEGLRSGGNDYLRKPYGIELLRERVKNAIGQRSASAQFVRRGPLTLDTIARRASINGEDLLLQQMEFALLLFLIRNEGQPTSTESIYEKVWGRPMAGDKNAVQMAVSRLRKKIEPAGFIIQSLYGKGYVFLQG